MIFKTYLGIFRACLVFRGYFSVFRDYFAVIWGYLSSFLYTCSIFWYTCSTGLNDNGKYNGVCVCTCICRGIGALGVSPIRLRIGVSGYARCPPPTLDQPPILRVGVLQLPTNIFHILHCRRGGVAIACQLPCRSCRSAHEIMDGLAAPR